MCDTTTITIHPSRVGRPMGRQQSDGRSSCHINKHFLKLRLGILFRLSFLRFGLVRSSSPAPLRVRSDFSPRGAGLAPRGGRSQQRALLKPLLHRRRRRRLQRTPLAPFVRNGRMSDERTESAASVLVWRNALGERMVESEFMNRLCGWKSDSLLTEVKERMVEIFILVYTNPIEHSQTR